MGLGLATIPKSAGGKTRLRKPLLDAARAS